KYILVLDSDNKLAPGFVDKALAVMERQPQVGVVYGDMQYFGKQDTYKKVPMYDKLRILSGNYIDACTLIRAKVFEEVGTYDIQRVVGAYTDWELWIRIGKSSWEFHYTDSLAFFYRISENSMIDAIKDNYEKHLSAFNYIVNKHFDSYSYLIHEFSPIREKMKALEQENYRLKSIRKNPFTAWRRLLDIWK
ncbi:MAG: hypothetical protein K2Q22_07720, partial [Cytophagales bacterium]|nr:hypothetical protein [Cytophagales bacterium]